MNRQKDKLDQERPSNLGPSTKIVKEEILSPFDSGTSMSMTDLSSDLDLQSDSKSFDSSESTFQKPEHSKQYSSSSITALDSGCNLDSGYEVKDYEDEFISGDIRLESIQEAVHLSKESLKKVDFHEDQDKDGDTLLHLSVVMGNYEMAFHIISESRDFLNVLNNLYQTPLHIAVHAGESKLVRRLVVAGALVDLQDHNGNTPFHLACQNGDYDCLRALTVQTVEGEIEQSGLKYGPVHEVYKFMPEVTRIRNFDGQTCVHLAVSGGFKILEYLIHCGVDINIKDGKSGLTVLHLAVQAQQPRMVMLLLSHPKVDVQAKNYAKRRAIDLARNITHYNHPSEEIDVILTLLTRDWNSRYGASSGGLESQGEDSYDSDESYDSSDED